MSVRSASRSFIIASVLTLSATAMSSSSARAASSGASGDLIGQARAAMSAGHYQRARRALIRAAKRSPKPSTWLAYARLEVLQGQYDAGAALAKKAMGGKPKVRRAAALVLARALAARGKVKEGIAVLKKVSSAPEARRARLELGTLLLREGKEADARAQLMTIVQDYNDDAINSHDPDGLALVGRAAALLRSRADANDAFTEAEQAGNKTPELMRWRAELFLEAHDPGHAEEVLLEALKRRPNDPDTLTMLANVKLVQAYDFDAATRLLAKAFEVNPNHTGALFVQAGIALRDGDHAACTLAIDKGLGVDPTNLPLLSMRAAERFLADDDAGFEVARKRVLRLNANYSKFYDIVSDYADWEHRYIQIVRMMREAVKVNPQDGQAWAVLGLNLLRLGQQDKALEALRTAWDHDHYNVRVYNTLKLYEDIVPVQYVTDTEGSFRFRFEKKHAALLRTYIAPFMEQAFRSMVRRYHYRPPTPIGVELYTQRQWFGVRTSGLPATGIQGVCFGQTLAAMSPGSEPFDWGNVLWHELGHVFAIQISKAHVPRWFTEGLSEYETFVREPSWQREQDPALYQAMRAGKLPRIAHFNRAFTHVDKAEDVTMAYYAASQVVTYIAERWGMDKIVNMLGLWGQGKSDEQVIQQVLGLSAAQLDKAFRDKWLSPRLERYKHQFVPLTAPGNVKQAEREAKAAPKDMAKQVSWVLAMLSKGEAKKALSALDRLRKIDENDPNVRYLYTQVLLQKHKGKQARNQLMLMIKRGGDGYAVRMQLAELALDGKRPTEARDHLLAACRFDPTQTDPLRDLADLARKNKWTRTRERALWELSVLEQHDPRPVKWLLRMLVKQKRWEDAARAGKRAVFRNLLSLQVHRDYGQALSHLGKKTEAKREWEAALLCDGKEAEKNAVKAMLGGL